MWILFFNRWKQWDFPITKYVMNDSTMIGNLNMVVSQLCLVLMNNWWCNGCVHIFHLTINDVMYVWKTWFWGHLIQGQYLHHWKLKHFDNERMYWCFLMNCSLCKHVFRKIKIYHVGDLVKNKKDYSLDWWMLIWKYIFIIIESINVGIKVHNAFWFDKMIYY